MEEHGSRLGSWAQPPRALRLEPGAWEKFCALVELGAGTCNIAVLNSAARHARSRPEDRAYVAGLVEHHHENTLPFLTERCAIQGKALLEVGAGTGGLAVAAVQAGARSVTGVEPGLLNWEAGVWRVKAYGLEDRIPFLHVPDTSRLPFADASFDVCVCSSVLQYVPAPRDRRRLLAEMYRVTRPGGLLAICASGNGLYPGGRHTTAWWSNLLPRRAARLHHARGVTYGELRDVLAPLGATRVRPTGPHDSEVRRWHDRALLRTGGAPGAGHAAAHAAFRLWEATVCRALDLPIEAFLPFLTVAFRKG